MLNAQLNIENYELNILWKHEIRFTFHGVLVVLVVPLPFVRQPGHFDHRIVIFAM